MSGGLGGSGIMFLARLLCQGNGSGSKEVEAVVWRILYRVCCCKKDCFMKYETLIRGRDNSVPLLTAL